MTEIAAIALGAVAYIIFLYLCFRLGMWLHKCFYGRFYDD